MISSFNIDTKSLYRRALAKWGRNLQMDVAIEEFAELTQRLIQFKRGRVSETEVLEEVVDCYIMLEQLKLIFDHELKNKPDFLEWYERKLLRLKHRLTEHRSIK